MSKAHFGIPHDPTIETDLRHIHVPVIVEPNYLGSEPILGAEPWVVFEGQTLGPVRLLWQNENDSDAPFAHLDLRAGRTYQIPLVARTLTDGSRLSGRAVTTIPDHLLSNWELKCGIPRITNGNHYFTFTGLVNLEPSEVYPVFLEVRSSNGKVVLKKKWFLHVPYVMAGPEEFFLN